MREFLYILFFVALIVLGVHLIKATYSDDMLSQEYAVYVNPMKNPYNQNFHSSNIATQKNPIVTQSLVDNPLTDYTNQNHQLPSFKPSRSVSSPVSHLPSAYTPKGITTDPVTASSGGGITMPIPYGFGSGSGKSSSSGTGAGTLAQGLNLSSSGHLSSGQSLRSAAPPAPFSDYIEGDITHPGANPVEDPIESIPVGNSLLALFLMGIAFVILKSGIIISKKYLAGVCNNCGFKKSDL